MESTENALTAYRWLDLRPGGGHRAGGGACRRAYRSKYACAAFLLDVNEWLTQYKIRLV
jgi:hypothetical protein